MQLITNIADWDAFINDASKPLPKLLPFYAFDVGVYLGFNDWSPIPLMEGLGVRGWWHEGEWQTEIVDCVREFGDWLLGSTPWEGQWKPIYYGVAPECKYTCKVSAVKVVDLDMGGIDRMHTDHHVLADTQMEVHLGDWIVSVAQVSWVVTDKDFKENYHVVD